jgi:hypothetical protein
MEGILKYSNERDDTVGGIEGMKEEAVDVRYQRSGGMKETEEMVCSIARISYS